MNNVCVPSDVSPLYAPEGKSLISVSLLGLHRDEHIPTEVKKELAAWFGEQVDGWQHLRTDIIKHALPEQAPKENPQNNTKEGQRLSQNRRHHDLWRPHHQRLDRGRDHLWQSDSSGAVGINGSLKQAP